MLALMHARTFGALLAAMPAALSLTSFLRAETPPPPVPGITIQRGPYLGWSDALVLGNGVVEAVVVPAVGRVMQFRFAGEADGPFWANAALLGRQRDPAARDWANFGGDKVWPAPQEDWARLAGRPWPPPVGFDGRPMEATVDSGGVTLVSPIDSSYGIRVRRRIELTARQAVMIITTRLEKTTGAPVEIGVWTVTQVREPVMVGAVLADASPSGAGFVLQSETPPAGVKTADGLVTLVRDPAHNTKIGLRAATLIWVGERELLRIDSPLVPDARYPDQGCSAEIYTNADPLAYEELETLGPLERLAAGGSVERRSTYTLARRAGADPRRDVQMLLGRP